MGGRLETTLPNAVSTRPLGRRTRHDGAVRGWWRRLLAAELERVRRDGRAAVLWSMRITVAATASYVVGTLFFPGTQPLLAPLTAMLVVQVTPMSLLASGVDRVVAVVAGVSLAIGFAAVVPLEWWSLGLLILVAITIGQYLRLRSNLIEVAISAMLVLGVGALGAESAAGQRLAETLVGAAGGVLMTLLFPPKVAVSDAGHAIDGLADRVSALLNRAAAEIDDVGADDDPQRLADRLRAAALDWLDASRRITHDIPEVGAALLRAEEGRRLNVRGLSTPHVEPGLRQGLEALEHTAVSIRGLMRDLAESTDGSWLSAPGASVELTALAQRLREMAAGIDAFGELVRNEGDVHVELSAGDVTRLRTSLEDLHRTKDRLAEEIAASPSTEVLELRTAQRSTVKRLLRELDLDQRVRRQLRLMPPRRRPGPPHHHKPRPPAPPIGVGPDDETQVLPPPRRRRPFESEPG